MFSDFVFEAIVYRLGGFGEFGIVILWWVLKNVAMGGRGGGL